MHKEISIDDNMSRKILSAVNKTADIVGITMGPVASNVILSNKSAYTRITKDGITVLRYLNYNDPIENAALRLIREASEKTNVHGGDGTTGTCILTNEIYQNGLKILDLSNNINRICLRNGIEKGAKLATDFIKNECVREVEGVQDIYNVAKIASNHSEEISKVLTDVFEKIGKNGVVKVDNGNTTEIVTTITEGMQFSEGYISPYFINNAKLEADLDHPYILLVDKVLNNFNELLTPLQHLLQTNRPILIIANGVEGDALSSIIYNKNHGLPICAVKSPSYGDNRRKMLDDIAILTGGQVIASDTGITISQITPESGILGVAKRVVVTSNSTTIIDGLGSPEAIQARINQIKTELDISTDEYTIKKLNERLAKLDGGIGIISVGAATESEQREKRDLVDDAFHACKSAISGGIVAGGGITLLHAAEFLNKLLDNPAESELIRGCNQSELRGIEVVRDALQAPFNKIVTNAGKHADLVKSEVFNEKKQTSNNTTVDFKDPYGYDVLNKQYGKMVSELEIVDSADVIISEIKNSASIAGLLLTSSAAVVEVKDDEDKYLAATQATMQAMQAAMQ